MFSVPPVRKRSSVAAEKRDYCFASNCIHRAGRCRNDDRTREHSANPPRIGAQIPRHQTHVVIERQPRHDGGVWRGNASVVRKVVGHQLLEIGHRFLCDIMTPAGRRVDPDVYCRYAVFGRLLAPGAGPCRAVKIQQVDLDDRWSGFAGLRFDVLGDVPDDSGRRENDRRRRVAQHRTDPLIAGATQRNRKRNRDQPGLQCAEKRDDVVEPLRCQYHSAVTGRPAIRLSSRATFSARRYSCDHVRVSATPSQSCS